MFALLIPTGSDHDRNRVPVATFGLIAANVLIYVVAQFLNYEAVVRQFGFVAAEPHWYQFITHLFLHAGWPREPQAEWTAYLNAFLHIGGNMAYLWFAGSDLEDVLGPIRFLAVYFLSGIASAGLFWATAVAGHFPDLSEPAVGASGAVSGLLGLYAVRFPRFKIRIWFGAFVPIPFILRHGIERISSLVFIGFWIGLQLFFGFQALSAGGAEVAYWGHIGGFLLGLGYGLATRQWRSGQEEYLFKEAEHLFSKGRFWPAMELYQRLAAAFPRHADARVKWALCWECTGNAKRAEKVLLEGLELCHAEGWDDTAVRLRAELDAMLGAAEAEVTHKAAMRRAQEEAAVARPAPNLMFRREFKWKEKKR